MKWAQKTLENLLTLNRSGYWGDESPSKARPIQVKVIRNADLTRHNSIKGYAVRYFSPKEAANAELQVGDIAMSSSGDVGKSWLVDEPGYSASNFIRILRPDDNQIMPSFLKYVLESDVGQAALTASTAGTTIQNLQKTFYSMLTVPLPSLAEQQHIVRLLDEALEAIAIAKANAEKNLQNARELFESRLRAAFTQDVLEHDHAEGGQGAALNRHWPTYSLGELTSDRPISYGVLKPGPRQTKGVPLIRITDIKDNILNESDLYFITEHLSQEFKRSILQGGEVLLSIQGTIGRVAIYPKHLAGANISRTIALIATDERVDREFLRYWLLSAQDAFPVGGATRDSLNIGDIRNLRCPAPPLLEQQRIVRLLGNLETNTDAIAAIQAEKLTALDNLKHSLLSQALAGRSLSA